ncbi:MAG TPA: nitroreductase/quinone reductase family protein [Thermoleophilaceae bacterium]|nr:nitroreductase/quinone reductase family protein [Thermoleophilaceae bacterium]
MSGDRKRRMSTWFTTRLVNPVVRFALEHGLAPPSVALLETIGRRSGEPRRTPVGNGLRGDVFWIVTEHGRRAAYVRNIEANPRVRVKVGRNWREGTAQVLPDDDPYERMRTLGRALNDSMVRLVGTEHLTIRVDLDTGPGPLSS